jgi:hypothetical protein
MGVKPFFIFLAQFVQRIFDTVSSYILSSDDI